MVADRLITDQAGRERPAPPRQDDVDPLVELEVGLVEESAPGSRCSRVAAAAPTRRRGTGQ